MKRKRQQNRSSQYCGKPMGSSLTQTVTWGDPNPAPKARLSATHTAPVPGQTIILNGVYYDQNKNLSAATIRDLGPGNKNGHMDIFPSIETAGEAVICTEVYIDRSFTFPPYTPSAPILSVRR